MSQELILKLPLIAKNKTKTKTNKNLDTNLTKYTQAFYADNYIVQVKKKIKDVNQRRDISRS